MATSSSPQRKRKPMARRPAPKTVEVAQIKQVIPQITEKPKTVEQAAQVLALKDKEISLLKQDIVRQQKKLAALKNFAVHMGVTASKTNSVTSTVVNDWATALVKTINGR